MSGKKTRKTMLLALSEQQAAALRYVLSVGFVCEIDAPTARRLQQLCERGMVRAVGISDGKAIKLGVFFYLTEYGYAAVAAYRTAAACGQLKEVA